MPLTDDILSTSRALVAGGYNGTIGQVVADIQDGNAAQSATGVRFRFTTSETMNQDYIPTLGIDDRELEGYSPSGKLFTTTQVHYGTRGNDQFDIEVDGVDFRADLEIANLEIIGQPGTVIKWDEIDVPRSIDAILYEVWHRTNTAHGDLDFGGNGIYQAKYAGVNLQNVFKEGINDNMPSAIADKSLVTVTYSVNDGKFTISSSNVGRSSSIGVSGDVWMSTDYAGLPSVMDAFGFTQEGRSDTGTGTDFTFVFSGADDTYSMTMDTFGLLGLGADNDVDLRNLDIGSQPGALAAVDELEAAITSVNKSQTKIGTAVNYMERRADALDAYTEHIAEHKARIEEIDFAAETQKLASLQILLQSSTASLAQANIIPQTLLQLLA
jgi:flagellin-like hook-associated protein FlgL